jgi:Tfp pilus assembly protein PilF
LALYYNLKGDQTQAATVLQEVVHRHPAYPEAYLLLGDIYEAQSKWEEARRLYRQAPDQQGMPLQARDLIHARLRRLAVEQD